jgi:hypothetical protein
MVRYLLIGSLCVVTFSLTACAKKFVEVTSVEELADGLKSIVSIENKTV